jgi:hypothetical protein
MYGMNVSLLLIIAYPEKEPYPTMYECIRALSAHLAAEFNCSGNLFLG